ncbi:hypothetical protein CQW23_08256 [Capsicum baccatum]|uniref:PB1-like domain-containing protein n=1 Tax=Capsicum baccatum TaxID=33114 RepID=A0A2G2X8F0_CAPBA|nr:hypothetical protein CQW23_08256 [Capsicum baccatum]
MNFELITLRFYHGGELNMGKVKRKKGKRYEGGQVIESLDVDVDRLSLFEFRDYVNYLGYIPKQCLLYVRLSKCSNLKEIRLYKDTIEISKKLGNGQVLEAFVCHMVVEPELAPLLKFTNDEEGHVEGKSGVSFNKDAENDIGSVDRASKNIEDVPLFDQPTVHTSSPSLVQPITHTSPSFVQPTAHISSLTTEQPNVYVSSSPTDQPTAHVSSPISAAPSSSTTAPANSHVVSNVESINGGVEIGSDMDEYVDEELRNLREEKRKIKRRKRGERSVIPKHSKLGTGRKGLDIGYDEFVGGDRNSLEGKLAGDEPVYPSDEATSFETKSDDVTDEEDEVEHKDKARRRKKVLDMKMWPQSQNISVMPPPVRKMPGRPGKNRKKEEGAPTAGTNANLGPSSSAGADPNAGSSAVPSATPSIEKGRGSTGRGRGRPPKNSTEKIFYLI